MPRAPKAEAPELVAPRTMQKWGHRAAGSEDSEQESKVRKCEFQWASESHEQDLSTLHQIRIKKRNSRKQRKSKDENDKPPTISEVYQNLENEKNISIDENYFNHNI